MARVTTIPATITKYGVSNIEIKKRRVDAYARVSTDHEDQASSYEAQVDYYEHYIKSKDEWEFVEIYTDEGISGTSTKYRAGFNKMVEDALSGKIDLIITKSVSRFARNTVDSLSTIRKLKDSKVECYFEKENIWTFDGKGELLITIMSSLAQEESRSISENCVWGQRKRFADGKVTVPFARFVGYDRGPNGELIVNQVQAETVKFIYSSFLKGYSPSKIARMLEEKNIKSPGGKERWNASNIRSILSNEKYKGDALLQKTYTVDFLTKKKKANEGEIPQYYVEKDHEAIISDEVFDMVQDKLALSKFKKNKINASSIFAGKVICGDCGSAYGAKTWHSTDKYKKIIYQCNNKFKNKCKTPHLLEETLKEIFVKAFNKLIQTKDTIISKFESLSNEVYKVDDLKAKQIELEEKINEQVKEINEMIEINARVPQNQREYQTKYLTATALYESLKEELQNTLDSIKSKNAEKEQTIRFISIIKDNNCGIEKFDDDLFMLLVESYHVFNDGKIIVEFKNGIEIEI